MEIDNTRDKVNFSKFLLLIPVANIMLLLIIRSNIVIFETVYILWTLVSYIIWTLYFINKSKRYNKVKNIFEEKIEEKDKLIHENEYAVTEFRKCKSNGNEALNNAKNSMTKLSKDFDDLIKKYEKFTQNIKLSDINETNSNMQISKDKLHEMQKSRDNIAGEVYSEMETLTVVLNMIKKISEKSLNVNLMLEELLKSSGSIESSVVEIQKISSETNILALNASIEAARAGENGMGFSIISTEIRKLAEQTKGASTRIQEVVADIQNKMKNAVDTKNKGGDILGDCIIKSEEMVENSKVIEKDMGKIFEELAYMMSQSKKDEMQVDSRLNEVQKVYLGYMDIIAGLKNAYLLTNKALQQIEIKDF